MEMPVIPYARQCLERKELHDKSPPPRQRLTLQDPGTGRGPPRHTGKASQLWWSQGDSNP